MKGDGEIHITKNGEQRRPFIAGALASMVDELKIKNISPEDLFKMCDKDKSGQIDIKEFADMIKVINGKWTIKQVAAMRDFFDSDASGKISKQEFLDKMRKAHNLRETVD